MLFLMQYVVYVSGISPPLPIWTRHGKLFPSYVCQFQREGGAFAAWCVLPLQLLLVVFSPFSNGGQPIQMFTLINIFLCLGCIELI